VIAGNVKTVRLFTFIFYAKTCNMERTYPYYAKGIHNNCLYAFVSKKEMYRISIVGSNPGNEGITIDHYITRRTVIMHEKESTIGITRELFVHMSQNLYEHIIDKIANSK